MLKDDWLMRIINQSARMIGNIIKQIQSDDLDVAQVQIDEALSEYVGVDSTAAETMTAADMIARFGGGDMHGSGKLIFLADLMQVEALICDKEEDEVGAYNRRLKALDLRLELAIGRDLTNANFDTTIDDLLDALDEYELPSPTLEKLFLYYERSEQYDLAAETLDELIEESRTTELIDLGLAFYERLMLKNDTELEVGNLTRDEVQEGFDALWQMQ